MRQCRSVCRERELIGDEASMIEQPRSFTGLIRSHVSPVSPLSFFFFFSSSSSFPPFEHPLSPHVVHPVYSLFQHYSRVSSSLTHNIVIVTRLSHQPKSLFFYPRALCTNKPRKIKYIKSIDSRQLSGVCETFVRSRLYCDQSDRKVRGEVLTGIEAQVRRRGKEHNNVT